MLRPRLRSDDFDMEKKVILEEIGMYQDQPMWSAYERVMREHFGSHPLGNSVLGTSESVGGLSRDQMKHYFGRRYVASNMLVAVAGRVDWSEFCSLIDRACSAWPSGAGPRH